MYHPKFLFGILCVLICTTIVLAKEKTIKVIDKDLLKKSIVFDKHTPNVFYCPISKPSGYDNLIVRYDFDDLAFLSI